MSGIRSIATVLFLIVLSGAPHDVCGSSEGGVPVLVELFTAEGCSTCPPADRLLEGMLSSQPAAGVQIVGVGEHVDYWDRLGWKDRFSSAAFTRRQQLYADHFKAENVYTPQMVVDGQTAFVGSDIEAARHAIERAAMAPHGVIELAVVSSSVAKRVVVNVTARTLPIDPDDRADVIVALVEDGLRTEVKGGENQGRSLSHAAVARELVTAGAVTGDGAAAKVEIKLGPDWRPAHMRAVAFVQERRSRRVLATASAPLA